MEKTASPLSGFDCNWTVCTLCTLPFGFEVDSGPPLPRTAREQPRTYAFLRMYLLSKWSYPRVIPIPIPIPRYRYLAINDTLRFRIRILKHSDSTEKSLLRFGAKCGFSSLHFSIYHLACIQSHSQRTDSMIGIMGLLSGRQPDIFLRWPWLKIALIPCVLKIHSDENNLI